MIFGAPGCGKTSYLLSLLEELLKDNSPNRIAFSSFTKKGSYEGKDRALQKFNFKEKDFPYFKTIHALAFRELNLNKQQIISKKHYRAFSKAMGMNFVGYYTHDFSNNDDQYLFFISLEKNNPVKALNLLELNPDFGSEKSQWIKRNYERFKKEMNLLDFDDVLIEFISKGISIPVDVVLIDEAQDLTTLQWEFCKVAFRNSKDFYIAGDDDQAIYEWSGADLNHFLGMTSKSEVVVLDQSYRLNRDVLNFSKKVLEKITQRVPKNFLPSQRSGDIRYCNNFREIEIKEGESYFFLSRNNYYLTEFQQHFRELGLVFFYKNTLSINLLIYRAIHLYEKLIKSDPGRIRKEMTLIPFLKKDLDGKGWFDDFNIPIEDKLYYDKLIKNKVNINKCNIHINTIHGVKGGEADNVVLKLDLTKRVYENFNRSVENYNSELRCLYVALTRTKNTLYIVQSKSKFGYDSIIKEILNDE